MIALPFDFIVPAGTAKFREFVAVGSRIFIKHASAEFEFQIGSSIEKHHGERGGKYNNGEPFNRIRVWNLSASLDLKGRLIVSDADVEFSDTQIPSTRAVGWTVNLVNDGIQDFPGYATDAANYVLHGVPVGARRKMMIVTLAAGVGGRLKFTNTDTAKVLSVFSTPGIAMETDDNLRLTDLNCGAIQSDAVSPTLPDIGVMEIFYL